VADAVAIVLCEDGHRGATYELCGPEVLTQSAQAAKISAEIKRTVRAQQIEMDEWERRARKWLGRVRA